MRFCGMILPGNGLPVLGSITVTGCPREDVSCDRFPSRSACVGTRAGGDTASLWMRPQLYWRKNWPLLVCHKCGIRSGPPTDAAPLVCSYGSLGVFTPI